jgi:hypothetical protein
MVNLRFWRYHRRKDRRHVDRGDHITLTPGQERFSGRGSHIEMAAGPRCVSMSPLNL